MTYHYELNCGQAVLHKDGVPIRKPMDNVAIAFDDSSKDDGLVTLHKHGDPVTVKAWAEHAKTALRQSVSFDGMGQTMADGIQVIEFGAFAPGGIPVVDLNEAINGNRKALIRLCRPQDTIDVDARVVVESNIVEKCRG